MKRPSTSSTSTSKYKNTKKKKKQNLHVDKLYDARFRTRNYKKVIFNTYSTQKRKKGISEETSCRQKAS
jgi:hypothetical protein